MNIDDVLVEPSGYVFNDDIVKQISREDFIMNMKEYDVVGFRVVLRES